MQSRLQRLTLVLVSLLSVWLSLPHQDRARPQEDTDRRLA